MLWKWQPRGSAVLPVLRLVAIRSYPAELVCTRVEGIKLRLAKGPTGVRQPVTPLEINLVKRRVSDTEFAFADLDAPAICTASILPLAKAQTDLMIPDGRAGG